MSHYLEKELQRYNLLLPSLTIDIGRFALIYGDELVGAYASYEEALAIGYERCGLQPFLVKRISETETIAYFTRDLFELCLT
jgi:hypothetical protein